ncbi:CMP-N-acetylneuraminate-beta-galactosamide-alpha-2,3-sialyltransferase 4 isoform X1 [Oryzias melastigma]|uniref:CMP-N-acetylneuraminate-beta-galactosamide-alpha-2,3-sialyltransferase 4 n=1 Tax=Oryzias melastigma TaxID=30732 RepID=A0A3B3BGR2_ORYME|nr:CMP-N-acetylneuraminate-beta-galactosamide-alpha-2,3-sialyltransferase 4 isoform X1 [Oryzias melastigma]
MTWIPTFRHFLTFLQIGFLFIIAVLTCNSFFAFLESSSAKDSPHPLVNESRCNAWEKNKQWKNLNFSTPRNTKLFMKLEDFFWKRYVSQLSLPFGLKGSEMFLLKVLAATASYEMPAHIENLKCKTCVVVGNSFAIKNSSLGSIINKHDVIIRINNGPIRGYEKDVGNKTTLRIFYPESTSTNPLLQNDVDTLMVLVPFKPPDLRWLKEILYDEKRVRRDFTHPPPLIWQVDSSKVRVLDPGFMYQTSKQMLRIKFPSKHHFRPSTGLLAVYVALNYCDVVHLAGFGYPPKQNHKQPVHYFETYTMQAMKRSPHDLGLEGQILKRLEKAGALMYLHPHL